MPASNDLRRRLEGLRDSRLLNHSDLWKFLLITLADRARNLVDEEGQPTRTKGDRPYKYDLALLAENEDVFASQSDLQRIASRFEQHGWATIARRAPVILSVTGDGIEEAQRLLDDIFEHGARKLGAHTPAADRYVQLDDNTPTYQAAITRLQDLIEDATKIRVNDWPEKEGVIESLKSALNMIKTKYVNKTTILSAVSAAISVFLVKFAQAPVAELANMAWQAVKALF